jgi:hypothetical protein
MRLIEGKIARFAETKRLYTDPIIVMFIVSLTASILAGVLGYWSFCWLIGCGTLIFGVLLLEKTYGAKEDEP